MFGINKLSLKNSFRLLLIVVAIVMTTVCILNHIKYTTINNDTYDVRNRLFAIYDKYDVVTDARQKTFESLNAFNTNGNQIHLNDYERNKEELKTAINALVENKDSFGIDKHIDEMLDLINYIDSKLIPNASNPAVFKKNFEMLISKRVGVAKTHAEIIKKIDNQLMLDLQDIIDHSSSTPNIILSIVAFVFFAFVLNQISSIVGVASKKLENVSTMVANGDLRVDLKERKESNEFATLNNNVKLMVQNLRELITEISNSASTLSNSTTNLKEANLSINEASDDVLTQVLSVGAAAEQMVSVSEEISQNCSHAATNSQETKDIAFEGMNVLRSTVDSIREQSRKTQEDAKLILKLGEQTQKIDGILSTIQDIANQTNLLALNAAIEAARAGEHGRGFAVVADEVRALASRTGESTKEISEMITTVQTDVRSANESITETVVQMDQVAQYAEKLQETLEVIAEKINNVNSQITQIATATEEQTATSSEMSKNIQKITEQSQKMNEKSKSTLNATADIEDLSMQMLNNVDKFTL